MPPDGEAAKPGRAPQPPDDAFLKDGKIDLDADTKWFSLVEDVECLLQQSPSLENTTSQVVMSVQVGAD